MKIIEIISEDQKQLDEAGFLSTIGLYFSRKFGTKFALVADDAIEKLAAKGRLSGPVSYREVMKHLQGTKIGKQMMSDTKLRNEIVPLIQKEANKVRDPSLWNKITGASRGSSAATNAAGKVGGFALAYKGLTAGLTAWGLYEMWAPPLQDYWESMDNAKANLDSGSWSIENYHHEENKQLSTLIGRLGAALLITSVPAMMLNNKLTRALLGKYLGGVLGLTMPAAVIFVRKWLNRDDNADGIAAIMMNDYIAGNAQVMGTPIPGLGSLAAKAKQAIMGDVSADPSKAGADTDSRGSAPAGTTTGRSEPSGDRADTNGKQDIDSTSSGGKPSKPTDNKKPNAVPDTAVGRKMWDSDPNAVRNFDITGWVTTPGKDNFIMDPKNPNRILPKPIDWRPD
jgi:hypothetical protein